MHIIKPNSSGTKIKSLLSEKEYLNYREKRKAVEGLSLEFTIVNALNYLSNLRAAEQLKTVEYIPILLPVRACC